MALVVYGPFRVRLVAMIEKEEYQAKVVWGVFWRKSCTGVQASALPSQLVGLWLAYPPVRNGVACRMSQGGFGASGLLWLHHSALWWHQVDIAATLLHPLVPGVGFRASLSSVEHLVCARPIFRLLLCTLILFSPCPIIISTPQMRKLRPRVPDSLT